MTTRRSIVLLTAAVIALASAAPSAADPKPPEVVIKIKRSPDYRLVISDRGVGICKNGDEETPPHPLPGHTAKTHNPGGGSCQPWAADPD